MIVEKNQIFNLMDTNGRRSDVLNALKVYLEILEELKEEYPTEAWNNYPSSIAQFVFYEKALEKSKDVFKTHKNYDKFIEDLGAEYEVFMGKNSDWIEGKLPQIEKVLDEAIEKRARHYTSNLVKIGFTDSTRNITEAGYSYLRNSIYRDSIESLFPLDNINITLIRQLLKLKIFGESENGKRKFYSPFLMALLLLLNEDSIDKDSFEIIVQGLTPYCDGEIKESIQTNSITNEQLETKIKNRIIDIPKDLLGKSDLDFDLFKIYFKSSKNNEVVAQYYYDFFVALRNFRNEHSSNNYNELLKCFELNGLLLNKAFGYGRSIFQIGNKGNRYDLQNFITKNKEHHLLTCENIISEIYTTFVNSKWIDGIKEYSDTTIRLLSATGLFKFKGLPELAYKDILRLVFDVNDIRNNIFGEMSEEEYVKYEASSECFFCKNIDISNILNYSTDKVASVVSNIENHLGVKTVNDVKNLLRDKKNSEFLQHINDKYPKEKIMEILPMFSDRRNDAAIKREVNDTATVPTIYEYIIGIAWYYISHRSFDLYNSLNLTLDADFEPVFHANGGDGDIVINYDEINVMLEVTLMNKQAQKRGEWEPVLRHSLNLKASSAPKETMTFFIADELDYNTINIWRAVAAVSLESTNTHQAVNGVVIMPFTNCEILQFLEKDISHETIISNVKKSFAKVPQITDVKWHEEIVASLLN